MAIRFQYNKISLNDLNKQLRIREKALPTIKSKEAALRLEVKRAKADSSEYSRQMDELAGKYEYMAALWGEFDRELIRVKDVVMGTVKVAGVGIPVLKEVIFEEKDYHLFSSPLWIADGIAVLKEIARTGLQREVFDLRAKLLEYARKKTTQKVNLYEKVQIPGYNDAIRKIKRFLEDEENLSKSSQKIVKTRKEKEEETAA